MIMADGLMEEIAKQVMLTILKMRSLISDLLLMSRGVYPPLLKLDVWTSMRETHFIARWSGYELATHRQRCVTPTAFVSFLYHR